MADVATVNPGNPANPADLGPARTAPGAVRAIIAAAVLTAALGALAEQAWCRGLEALAAARFVHAALGVPVGVARARQMFFFQLHDGAPNRFMGLGVSLGCSSLLLVMPVVLVTVVLVVASRIGLARLAAAFAVVSALIVAFNLLRLCLIALLVNAWGVETGFGWAHSFFGTLLTLVGLSLAAFVYLAVLRLGRR